LSALILLVLPALAFRPDPQIYQGSEPDRVRLYHKDVQSTLSQGAAWTDFARGEGQGWMARFDERTGTPHRAWGPGIDLGPLSDRDDVEAAMRAFFARNPGLLGVPAEALSLAKAGYVARTDTWYVRFEQAVPGLVGDVPVYEGAVEARVRFGKLILLGVETYPQADSVDTTPQISEAAARATAIARGPAPSAAHEPLSARLVVVALDDRNALDHRLAWQIRTRTEAPVGVWDTLVDAHTGELLNIYNEVKFLSGTLQATHDTRTVNGDYTTSAAPYATITGDDGSDTTTDVDGAWSLDDASSATTQLQGEKVCTLNDSGSSGSLTLTGDATWTTDSATQAEIDSYIFVHDVVTWNEEYAPEVGVYSDSRSSCGRGDFIVVHDNQSSTCNAYYDGTLNFFRSGGGCNNTGQIADVNYHEWGHGFHYFDLESGTYDSSISEGIGDTIAFMQTGDSDIAPYFYTSGGAIREVATDRVYPDDWVGESHEDGLIFAGSIWDLWSELDAMYPDDPGQAYDVLSQLMVDGLKGGPEIPDAYDDFVSADDDNGDLSDGTPHQCALITAFGYHGLGPAGEGGSIVSLTHTPLENQVAGGGDYTINADITNLAPTCVDFDGGDATLHYSSDDGATWSEVTLSSDTDSVWGTMPAQRSGTIVQYYISLTSSDGTTITAPTVGSWAPYTFYVGDLTEIKCFDFEDDDGGFTHELLDGRDELGADDWTWGKPHGKGGDPDYAYSGKKIWGNDLGAGDNYNGEYQDSKWNRLTSPAVDVSGADRVILQYRRWLGVEDGVYDQADVLSNGTTLWSNHASSEDVGDEQTEDDQWVLHTLEVPLDGTGSVQLAWEIISDAGLGFGGWNLDDVCLYAATPATPDTGDTGDTGAGQGGDDSGLSGGDDSGFAQDDTGVAGDTGVFIKTGCSCSSAPDRRGGLVGLLVGLSLLIRRRRR